jgi:hypothetical protein
LSEVLESVEVVRGFRKKQHRERAPIYLGRLSQLLNRGLKFAALPSFEGLLAYVEFGSSFVDRQSAGRARPHQDRRFDRNPLRIHFSSGSYLSQRPTLA